MVLRALLLLAALPAHADTYAFCWIGAGGYSMSGTMEAEGRGILTEADVTAFEITGFRDGVRIGAWSLADRTPETTWILTFDTRTLEFPTGGGPGAYQAWNADGTASDCGVPGFGFNAGNNAQDVCVDGVWVTDSMVDRDRPFLARRGSEAPDCAAVPLMGALTGATRSRPS